MNNINQSQNNKIINEINIYLKKIGADPSLENPLFPLYNIIFEKYENKYGKISSLINLDDMKEFFNIKKILITNKIENDALLIPVLNGFNIKLKKIKVNNWKRYYIKRVRFSCAHEMAHTFFYQIQKYGIPHRVISSHSKYEEILCDMGASELLMPSHIFNNILKRTSNRIGINCKTLLELSDKFNTSLNSVVLKALKTTENEIWNTYIGLRADPQFNDDGSINRFKIKWIVFPRYLMEANKHVIFPDIFPTNPLYMTLLSDIKRHPKRIGIQLKEKIEKIDDIEVYIYPLPISEKGFLILFSLKDYFNRLREISMFRFNYSQIKINFDFEDSTTSKIRKKIEHTPSNNLSDYI